MFFPDFDGVVFEAGEEVGHAARQGRVDSEFVDGHVGLMMRKFFPQEDS